jgi:hypothetical protein
VTIAHLAVKLSANAAHFHQEMQRAASRAQQTGRVFTRVGRDISQAISLPLIAGAFGAFRVLLAESARSFGPLFQATESLKAEFHDLFLAIARELEPTFKQIIGLLRGGIATVQSWVAAFHRLPEGVRQAVIFTLAFLAALGPTLFVVGKLITAIGALIRILPLLASPIGLAVLAVAALAAGALYVVTHWDWAKLRLALAWAFIKDLFFEGVRASILALDILTLGILKLTGVTDFLREKLDALADRSMAKSAAQIIALEAALRNGSKGMQTFGAESLKIRKIIQDATEATRQLAVSNQVLGLIAGDVTAGQVQILETQIRALIAAGVSADAIIPGVGLRLRDLGEMLQRGQEYTRAFSEALGAFGPRLDQQLRAIALFRDLIASGVKPGMAAAAVVAEGQAIQSVMEGLVGALTTVAERIGNIFAGVSRGFRGFAAQLGALIGTVMKQIGQTLIQMGATAIAMGVLGKAIKFFAKNPVAAIAAGAALIALGQALGAASERTLAQGFGGEGGGGGGAVAAASAGQQQGETTLVLRLETPDGLIASIFRDPRNQDAMAALLEELTGRRVITEPRDV